MISCSSSGSRDPCSSPKDIVDGPVIPLNGDADITSIEGGEINGLNMSLEVTDVETIDLPNILTTSYGVSLKVYKDAEKQNEVSKSAINLQNGENLFYIVVTSEDNKKSETYKLMVLKNCNVVLTIENEDLEAGTVEGAGKKAGGVSTTITATAKQGCSFEGWYDGDEKVSSEATYTFVMPMSNKTLLVKWTYNEYELTLVNDYPEAGTVEGGGFYEYCSRITVKATPNAGYTFAGWYSENFVSLIPIERWNLNMFSEDTTLEARWTPNEYTITFDANEGNAVDDIDVTMGEHFTLPVVERTGYIFEGWYTDILEGTKITYSDGTSVITWNLAEDTMLYARWSIGKYSIQLNKNIEEAGTVSSGEEGAITYNTSVTITATTNIGYIWLGWYDENSVKVSIENELTYTFDMPGNDIAYEARWAKVTISKNLEKAGNVSALEGRYNVGDSASVMATTNAGYIWLGWYDGETKVSTGDEPTFAFNMPNENKTYEARWKAKKFTLTLNPNQGVGVPASIIVTYDASYEIPAPTRAGYTFDGWYLDTVKVDNTGIWTKELDMEIMAHWTVIDYTIGYTLNGGVVDPANPIKYTTESLAITLNNPTKEGYTFKGWSGTELDGDTNKNVTIVSGSIGNRTYTANWTINQYTISFESNGGSAVSSITQDYGTTVTKPSDPIKASYDFKGWYTDNTTFNNAYTFDTMPAENFTIYAKWTATEYNIEYMLYGGTATPANQTKYTVESLDITLKNPTKEGYAFKGWSGTDLEGSTNMSVTITNGSSGHRTYMANWTINQYTISFDSNEGSAVDSITQDYATTVTKPSDPIKANYDFKGWYRDNTTFNNAYTFDTMPAENITIYAKWTATEYNIEYMLYGGTVTPANPTKYTVESLDITLKNPTKEGYTFKGWSGTDLEGSANMSVTITNGSSGHRTYMANWTINQYTISFESNGGSAVGSITQDYGTTVTKPSDPIKANYDFKGWYRDNTTFNNAYTFSTMPAENFTLYAKWTATEYNIEYMLYGGTVTPANPTKYTVESLDITLKIQQKKAIHSKVGVGQT